MCGYHREAWRIWWWWGAFLVTLSVIYLEFKAHLASMVSTISAAIHYPIWFGLSGTIICFSTGQWPNSPPGCVRTIWPRRRVMECCIIWPGLWDFLHEAGWDAKLSSWQRVATLKNLKSKIYFDLFNTFLVTTWFNLLFHNFDVFTIILQCRK